jgi:hypothetical protein
MFGVWPHLEFGHIWSLSHQKQAAAVPMIEEEERVEGFTIHSTHT